VGEIERFFFVHLQKTGGTALSQRIRQSFGPEAIYPMPEDHGNVASVLSVDHLLARFAAHRDQVRVISGHFPYCMVDVLDVPLRTFTILRDPVERTLSLLRRRSQRGDARFLGRAPEDIYDDAELHDIIRNHMVKMLSLTPEEMAPIPLTQPVTFDQARLERAMQNLERIDVVGVQEQFDALCDELEIRFGWDLGAPRFANRTEKRPVSDALRERIAEDNAMDGELYRFAQELIERRRSAAAAAAVAPEG
jgi:hypothetical protein